MGFWKNILGRIIEGERYHYLLRSPGGDIVAKDGEGASLAVNLGGGEAGPLDGFTATEAVSAGQVVVIEDGTQDVTPVQIDATTYTFEEIQRAAFDATGQVGSGFRYVFLQLDEITYFLAYNVDDSPDRIDCRLVWATKTGLTVSDPFDSGLSGTSVYPVAGKFSASRVLLREARFGDAVIAAVTGSAITFSAPFTIAADNTGLGDYYGTMEQVADGKILAAYQNGGGGVSVRVVTDQTTNVGLGDPITLSSSGYWSMSGIPIVRMHNSTFMVGYSVATNQPPKFNAVRVTGTSIETGDAVQAASGEGPRGLTLVRLSDNRAVTFWAYDATPLHGMVMSIDDLTITPHSIATIPTSASNNTTSISATVLDSEHVAVLYVTVPTSNQYASRAIVADIVSETGVAFNESWHDVAGFQYKYDAYEYARMFHLGSGVVIGAQYGDIYLYRNGYTGVTTTNIDGALGVIDTGGAALDPVTLWPLGDVASSFSGLTPGVDYYLHEDGTVDTFKMADSRYLGTAVSPTKMLTVPMVLNKFQPHHAGTDATLAAGSINEVSAAELRALVDNPPGGGDMLASNYDPQGVNADAFDASNHVYDNATSGLSATDAQAAVDELAALPHPEPGIDTLGIITSNLTLYVATTGSDTAGDGSSANPWATPQQATAWLSRYRIQAGMIVVVSIDAGSYTLGEWKPFHVDGAAVTYRGAGAGSTILDFGATAYPVRADGVLKLDGMTITGTGTIGIYVPYGGSLYAHHPTLPIIVDGFTTGINVRGAFAELGGVTIQNFAERGLLVHRGGYCTLNNTTPITIDADSTSANVKSGTFGLLCQNNSYVQLLAGTPTFDSCATNESADATSTIQ